MCGHKIREFESIYQKRKSIFFVPHRQKTAGSLVKPAGFLTFSNFLIFHLYFCYQLGHPEKSTHTKDSNTTKKRRRKQFRSSTALCVLRFCFLPIVESEEKMLDTHFHLGPRLIVAIYYLEDFYFIHFL